MSHVRNVFILILLGLVPSGIWAQQHRLPFPSNIKDSSFTKFKNVVTSQVESKNERDLAQLVVSLLGILMSSSFPTAVAEGIGEPCKANSVEYVENIRNFTLWALQMQESSGKLPVGFFGLGNYRADGLFDECLAVRAPNFEGEYCTVYLKPAVVDSLDIMPANETRTSSSQDRKNVISILQALGLLSDVPERVEPHVEGATAEVAYLPSISFCLPSTCTAQDLGIAVAQLIGSYVIANHSIVTIADEEFCFKPSEIQNPKPFDAADISVITVLSALGLLTFVSTMYESYRLFTRNPLKLKTETLSVNLLYSFSFLNNGRKLLSMKISRSSDNFQCIHGIRFFSMTWVILGHVFYFGPTRLALNQTRLTRDALYWPFQTISNATVAVDTFFVMSGLLASYLLLRELDQSKGKINIFFLYLHRYLRLTIVYAVILGFVATLIVYVGIGPNWFFVPVVSKYCRQHWWQSLLYLNNLYPGSEGVGVCMGHTWYLAVDMQLFLLAPLLIYPLWRWRKTGWVVLATATVVSLAMNFMVYALYNLPPSHIITRTYAGDVLVDFNDKYYVKPWTRAPPYFVGIWVGWLLHVTRNSYLRLSSWLVAGFWVLSTAISLAVLYGLAPYADQSKTPTIPVVVSMTYGPLHRTVWSVAIGWTIFGCSRGHGGIANRILSWKGFMPLGRLTYCMYLIHLDFLNVYFAIKKRLYYYTFYDQILTYMGLLLCILSLAFVISVAVEAPFMSIEKLLLAPAKKGNDSRHEKQINSAIEDGGSRTTSETVSAS